MSFLTILATLTILIIFLVLLIYLLVVYNALKEIEEEVNKSLANILVLLKQRFSELPQLVEVCKAYIQHEINIINSLKIDFESNYQDLLENIEHINLKDLKNLDINSSREFNNIICRAEAFPQLKSLEQFIQIQNRISKIEEQISDRKEFYNQTASIFNTRINSIPDIFIAKLCRLVRKDFITDN